MHQAIIRHLSGSLLQYPTRAHKCWNIGREGSYLPALPYSLSKRLMLRLQSSQVANANLAGKTAHKLNAKLFNLMRYYEDLIGLTEVKTAQRMVLEAERDFTETQESRREKQDHIREIQMRLKEIHADLDKTARGEDRYLTLLTQEHAIIKQERQLMEEFKRLERAERDCFTTLSNRLRDSHEKERERAEKTKYGSIIGSIVCGAMGIAGGLIINKLRLKDLKQIVIDSSEPARIEPLIDQLTKAVERQQSKINAFLNDLNVRLAAASPDMMLSRPGLMNDVDSSEGVLGTDISSSSGDINSVLEALKHQDNRLTLEMNEIKKLIAVEHGYAVSDDGLSIVYVGPEIKGLLDETERNLERRLKFNALVQVVAIYGTLAITLPILYVLFHGQ